MPYFLAILQQLAKTTRPLYLPGRRFFLATRPYTYRKKRNLPPIPTYEKLVLLNFQATSNRPPLKPTEFFL